TLNDLLVKGQQRPSRRDRVEARLPAGGIRLMQLLERDGTDQHGSHSIKVRSEGMINSAWASRSATRAPWACSRSHASGALDSAYSVIESRARHSRAARRRPVAFEAARGSDTTSDRWPLPTGRHLARPNVQGQAECWDPGADRAGRAQRPRYRGP